MATRTDEPSNSEAKPAANWHGVRRWASAFSLGLAMLLLVLTTSSCFLTESQRRIGTVFVYTDSGGTDVKVTYTVPPPPSGKVYVLWVLNPSAGKSAKIGQVPSGSSRVARAQVNFKATGVVVSIESDPGVQQMSNTWALRSGEVETPARQPAR